MTRLERLIEKAIAIRARLRNEEAGIQRRIGEEIRAMQGSRSLRGWARELGISAQHLCDLQHGRRKLSERMLHRLKGGK